MIETYVHVGIIVVLAINTLVALYGIVYRRSLVKKLISLTLLSDTVFIAIVFTGFIYKHPVLPPVYITWSEEEVTILLEHAVDPLPQALVLTGIVIGFAVNALIAFGIIQLYRLTKTTDARRAVKYVIGEVSE
ncbi:MAG: sodium:proton antiporter [Desulfurococcaceae archaeon]